ncbi:hypothetical protein RHGRI_014437 [Rhododendron griersonianum]|uniref:TF-B3 domain-containing protein n=1 Tax=Rhododendron griersonianum TaxID=479676 RepID=A0AAV6K9B1_9ERIC|nr:hypothetical protein RHGRI_014437 [Rhododendron griersonianum]
MGRYRDSEDFKDYLISKVLRKNQRLAKHKSESDYMIEPRCYLRARNPVPTYCDEADIGLPPLRKGSKLNLSRARLSTKNLPKSTVDIVLKNEKGADYNVVYIGKRVGLSGGWRGFALDQKLDDGDALVFELAEHLRVGSTSSKTRALHHPIYDTMQMLSIHH